MIIRKGSLKDTKEAEKLYRLAVLFMRENNINQWGDMYPTAEEFKEDVINNNALVVSEDKKIIAVATVYIGHDSMYDNIEGKWLTNNYNYGIIHRLSVDPKMHNKKVASKIVDYLTKDCIKNNITSLRCDTHSSNYIMQNFLLKNGYKKCGNVEFKPYYKGIGYEKIIKF